MKNALHRLTYYSPIYQEIHDLLNFVNFTDFNNDDVHERSLWFIDQGFISLISVRSSTLWHSLPKLPNKQLDVIRLLDTPCQGQFEIKVGTYLR
jgi:hypothetical protein